VDWKAPLLVGLKRSIKVGAALRAGLEHVPSGVTRRLTGRYLLYACFQLDTLVDALRDTAQVHRVSELVRKCLAGSHPLQTLACEAMASRELSLGERVKLLLLLRNLQVVVRSIEEALGDPRRVHLFGQKLSALTTAVIEDVAEGPGARDTLSALAPSYPAMGISSIEVLWLLQGRPLEEIVSCRPLLELGEQLARLEDDALEVWQALKVGGQGAEMEARVDARNLILRHARGLRVPVRAALEDACRMAGLLESRLERELERVACPQLADELRRVVTFFSSFTDAIMGPHRKPPEARKQNAACDRNLGASKHGAHLVTVG
jgi:hypothetical protein